jgi:tripartite-type tricarboxylate transporter receptor subunit TctC
VPKVRAAASKAALPVFIVACGIVAAGPAAAQSYPAKPVRLIVPTAPGATADIVARMLALKLTEAFKQSIVVDNRPGAGGVIGTEAAIKSNPDGYTMICVAATYATNAALQKLPYDSVNDVSPIALIGEAGFMVAVHPSLPVASIKELIAYDKANPGKLNYGSGGTGNSNHLVAEYFNQMAGTRMTHVPYKAAGLALNDLLGGQIHVFMGGILGVLPQVKSNRVRGIAVTTLKRTSIAPEIPTVAETVPGYEALSWSAVLGPKALPADIAARWNREINRILQMPEIRERLAGDGMEPVGGSPERFREMLVREIAKWRKVVKIANIKPEG